jgi:hypothetical protein
VILLSIRGDPYAKFASFIIKERQSLPVANHYLIVFNAYTVFLDWKITLDSGKN